MSKPDVVEALHNKLVRPMHITHYPPAYGPTNYQRWISMDNSNNNNNNNNNNDDDGDDIVPYEVDYFIKYEPYYIAKMPLPMFDWEFVDRGGNFAQQVLELHASGFRFWVLPDQFVIDIPHSNTGNAPKQTEDNQNVSNSLWRQFYLELSQRYKVNLPPYKGVAYRTHRKDLEMKWKPFQFALKTT